MLLVAAGGRPRLIGRRCWCDDTGTAAQSCSSGGLARLSRPGQGTAPVCRSPASPWDPPPGRECAAPAARQGLLRGAAQLVRAAPVRGPGPQVGPKPSKRAELGPSGLNHCQERRPRDGRMGVQEASPGGAGRWACVPASLRRRRVCVLRHCAGRRVCVPASLRSGGSASLRHCAGGGSASLRLCAGRVCVPASLRLAAGLGPCTVHGGRWVGGRGAQRPSQVSECAGPGLAGGPPGRPGSSEPPPLCLRRPWLPPTSLSNRAPQAPRRWSPCCHSNLAQRRGMKRLTSHPSGCSRAAPSPAARRGSGADPRTRGQADLPPPPPPSRRSPSLAPLAVPGTGGSRAVGLAHGLCFCGEMAPPAVKSATCSHLRLPQPGCHREEGRFPALCSACAPRLSDPAGGRPGPSE